MNFDDGRDYRTRHLGSVTSRSSGNRLSVLFDPKSGGPIRLEGDVAYDCEGDEPDEDGYCREPQEFVLYLSPEQAQDLARWLTEAAAASRAFFAETAETT